MSYYHIIIQQERRTQPERMAIPIGTSTPTGKIINDMPEYVAGPVQLHTHSAASLPENIDDPQFVMVAEWNLSAPYVVVHKGDYSKRNLHFGGWPEITKEQFDALPAATPVA